MPPSFLLWALARIFFLSHLKNIWFTLDLFLLYGILSLGRWGRYWCAQLMTMNGHRNLDNTPQRDVSLSNVFPFISFRTLYAQRSVSKPFTFYHLRTLSHSTEGQGISVSCPNRNAHSPTHACSLQKDANLPFYFQQLAGCYRRNPFRFKLLHCCPGVAPPVFQNGKEVKNTSPSGHRTVMLPLEALHI